MLDEIHLKYAGLKRKDLYGYYLTEENAKTVAVFGADRALRYSIPFMPAEKTIKYLKIKKIITLTLSPMETTVRNLAPGPIPMRLSMRKNG